ncbi:ATP-binding protein [Endozoicomonas arenosclerae]|uniref:ATP-binding protein n=1 Tax=Endozoicomonas arenosclerae TaxID=1633495 RepID=UPI0009A16429
MTVSFSSEESSIEITDTGAGIPFHERESVFKRFYRLEQYRGTQGNGLGLSLVKAICERHDAGISLSGKTGLIVRINLKSFGKS